MFNERSTLKINGKDNLEIAGVECEALAKEYGTPLYVMDEDYIRAVMREYNSVLKSEYGYGMVKYASKAFCCKAMHRLALEENLGLDVVSGGELYTALSVDFPTDKIYFHGNNKSLFETEYALKNGVARFVVDSVDEIEYLDGVCGNLGIRQKVLLRVNPGVEAHTHHFIQTAKVDSKFGLSLQFNFAKQGVLAIKNSKNLDFYGLHCHIGSQIFDRKAFALATVRMTEFIAELKNDCGIVTEELNMGGGYGIWYAEGDKRMRIEDYGDFLREIIVTLNAQIEKLNIKKPFLSCEPGRSIVGEAGITLYSVGTIKDITGIRKFVSVDGGMFENPRYALYQAKYTAVRANGASGETEKVTLTGKCCESGDMLIDDAFLPKNLKRGDIVAVFSTGAYNYSMASNYNRNLVPPVVGVSNGRSRYMVRPQSYEDLIRHDE